MFSKAVEHKNRFFLEVKTNTHFNRKLSVGQLDMILERKVRVGNQTAPNHPTSWYLSFFP